MKTLKFMCTILVFMTLALAAIGAFGKCKVNAACCTALFEMHSCERAVMESLTLALIDDISTH